MAPIGDTLRRERLRRNLELPQIAEQLKISVRFLQAIEEERFEQLPAAVFAKNFVRQYAQLLELDGEEMASQAQRMLDAGDSAPGSAQEFKPDVPDMPVEIVDLLDGRVRSPGSSWIAAAALFVAALLVCSAAYWWWERPRQPAALATPPAPGRVAEPPAAAPVSAPPPETMVSAAPATAAPPTAVPAEAAGQPAGAPSNAAGTPPPAPSPAQPAAASAVGEFNPNAAVRVEITALDLVWVRAQADGKVAFMGMLQRGQVRSVSAGGAVELRIGNAGGASITLNGKPLEVQGNPPGVAGPKGQVVEVQLTSGGFQIVPSKAPDPADR